MENCSSLLNRMSNWKGADSVVCTPATNAGSSTSRDTSTVAQAPRACSLTLRSARSVVSTLHGLRRFTEENVTEEYIRNRVKQHLVSMSQGNSNGLSLNFVNYTMFLTRKDISRWESSVPILKPQPAMSAEDITTYMHNSLNYNRLKRDGFSDAPIAAAIPKVVEHHWGATVQGIKLAETAARSWCAVWTELIGDEEE